MVDIADYICTSKTNYFKTTDPAALKELVSKISGAELWEKDGYYAFGAYGNITEYFRDAEYDENGKLVDGTDDYDLIYAELQKLLPPGEAVVITEVGHEKLCYLNSFSVIVTRDKIDSINLISMAEERAGTILKTAGGLTCA